MSPLQVATLARSSWFVQLAATTLHKSHSVSDRSKGEAELTHPLVPIVRAALTAKRAIRRARAMLVARERERGECRYRPC